MGLVSVTGPAPLAKRVAVSRGAVARQRQVVTGLAGALMLCVAVAVVTGASAAWWAAVALLPLACAYVAVLARSKRIAAEREISYAFFGRTGAEQHGLGGIEELFPVERERAVAGRSY
jgi:hypothetical protein